MKKEILFYFIFFTIVSGCSTISYTEPTDGKLSKVRFTTNTKNVLSVSSYSNENCENEQGLMSLRDGYLFNSSPKKLGIPLWSYHKNAAKEFFFRANKNHYFIFYGSSNEATYRGSNVFSCAVPLAVKFSSKKDYELSYKLKGKRCMVEISIIERRKNNYVKKKSHLFYNNWTKECQKVFDGLKFW